MPINSCSINAYTINSLRCRRHTIVPPPVILHDKKSHPYHTRIDPTAWQDHEEPFDISQLEGPSILFTITMNGETHQATYDNAYNEMIPMVTLNSLNINTVDDLPSFEISNFNIRAK